MNHDMQHDLDAFLHASKSALDGRGTVSPSADAALLERLAEAGVPAAPVTPASTPASSSMLVKAIAVTALLAVAAVAVIVLRTPEVGSGPEPSAGVTPDTTPSPETAVDAAPSPPDPARPGSTPMRPPVPAAEGGKTGDDKHSEPPTEESPEPTTEPTNEQANEQKPAVDPDEAERSPAELFARANRHRRGKRWQQARDAYLELAKEFPESRERRMSRVALGDLYRTRFAKPGRALDEYDAYLEQASAGNLTEDALVGRALALEKLGRSADAEAAWDRLRRDHPNSVHLERAPEPEESPE